MNLSHRRKHCFDLSDFLLRRLYLGFERRDVIGQIIRLVSVRFKRRAQFHCVVFLNLQRLNLTFELANQSSLLGFQFSYVFQRFRVLCRAKNLIKLLLQSRAVAERPIRFFLMHEDDIFQYRL